ncbi:MAG: helix-turn-helix domain-containing protein [Clostridia bacterium]|nr:helix-turn-helix domain-containing protein [Clostridia bacterium]
MSSLTKRLKAAIEKADLSYEEIEEKLELEEGTVKRWVGGKEEPDTQTVKALAGILGVSADSILFGVEKIGEMKAMFPNEVTPMSTPMSDWRFLLGAIMVFTGAAGMLLMFMRYSIEGIRVAEFFEAVGLPAYVLITIAVAGVVLCVVSCILSLRTPKKKKRKNK